MEKLNVLTGHKDILSLKSIARAMALLLMLAIWIPSQAQGWDGSSYAQPPGKGTQDDPYLISEAAHLEWMRLQNNTFAGKYFSQECDISLGGHEWLVMYPNKETTSANDTKNCFSGTYNGNGYAISDYVIYWDNMDRTIGFGLFSAIQNGTVTDLIIRNAHITRHAAGTPGVTFFGDNTNLDVKMGILAAGLGTKAVVSNVSLIGCRIDDGGNSTGSLRTVFAGGLAGNVASSYNGSSTMSSTTAPQVKFVSSNVHIDLSSTRRNVDAVDQNTQFNVGGLVGRVRRGTTKIFDNCVYTGDMKAPTGTVGPIYGMYRTSAEHKRTNAITHSYAGETNDTNLAYPVNNNTLRYYNYRVWNPLAETPEYETMSDTYPAGGDGWLYDTRTFKANSETTNLGVAEGLTGDEVLNSPEVWARFQGVNRGLSLDGDTQAATESNLRGFLVDFNNALTSEEYYWDIKDGVPQFERNFEERTIYVYDKEFNDTYPEIAGFDGVDPDGEAYPGGDDANDGFTPWTAVKTLKAAYARLLKQTDYNLNTIVVMGAIGDVENYRYTKASKFARSAVVTGRYHPVDHTGEVLSQTEVIDYNGTIVIYPQVNPKIDANGNTSYTMDQVFAVDAATMFENISFWSAKEGSPTLQGEQCYFYARKHDLVIGHNVTFKNFPFMAATQGLASTTKIPAISIIAGMHNYNETPITTLPQNADPHVTTIKVYSGGIARIIGSFRNNALMATSHNICGAPDSPHRSDITIDISPEDGVAGNPYYVSKGYTHDLGILTGGQTDGAAFADIYYKVYRGRIARYVSGNISYGRDTGDTTPDDSFFGQSVIDIYGGEFDELYGGSLGRFAAGSGETTPTTMATPYFYGISQINFYDGEINGNLYGAGAGGVSGIGQDTGLEDVMTYTPDPFIPYYNTSGELLYGDYHTATAAGNTVASVTVTGTDRVIDLTDTRMSVNIYGGRINGNVYGGGYGYVALLAKERVPYHVTAAGEKIAVAGNVYGTTEVNVYDGVIVGNVYGGSEGSSKYEKEKISYNNSHPETPITVDFTHLAQVFGETRVQIAGGVIGLERTDDNGAQVDALDHQRVGNVYGGSQGVAGYDNMGTLYGNSNLVMTGGKVMHHLFGGCDFANVSDMYPAGAATHTGDTRVSVSGGTLGNCIFGGSRGTDGTDGNPETCSSIAGNTYVTVSDGEFIGTPYLNERDSSRGYRTFNIYGGGYLNCIVAGNANVKMMASLLQHAESFMSEGENPNEWPDAVSDFQRAYMDITYRRFCVYGGGFGELTRVLNTNVTVDISTSLKKPHGYTLVNPYFGQSFFDIAGGGYSGDVGYWADNGLDPADPGYDAYDHYVGGDCEVHIDGYTYARKIIGGGFYGSCYNTNTTVTCGSLRQIYGGSLLGNVHGRATLTFGNRVQDFIPGWNGNRDAVDPAVWDEAARRAKALNDYIYITENIYGGNDVEGIVGTARWRDPDGNYGVETTDGSPLYCAETDPSTGKGVVFNIYGGIFMGDVYGAGNGYYRGYYVPEWVRYVDGRPNMYSPAISSTDPSKTGYVYRGRPMVGNVRLNISGNSEDDFVSILGDFYAAGRECTIGQWNTFMPAHDPRRLIQGGVLKVNFGSHVHVKGSVYMGPDGRNCKGQTLLETPVDLSTFNGSTTKELMRLGEAAYGHWFYNPTTKRYEPGFPMPGVVDGNYGLTGEHMLRSFVKNIEMQCDLEITFYDDIYEKGADKTYIYNPDGSLVYRHWVPGELALTRYDVKDVEIGNFFLGGRCGSLTNNTVKYFDYSDESIHTDPAGMAGDVEDVNQFGAIYRVAIPEGVTVTNALVMGSRDAISRIYRPTADFTGIVTDDGAGNPVDPVYIYEGGVITQVTMSFDVIAYNDMQARADDSWQTTLYLPSDFYTSDAWSAIRDVDTYTLLDGTELHRWQYSESGQFVNFHSDGNGAEGVSLDDPRYNLAVTYDAPGVMRGYIGAREGRTCVNAVRLNADCSFALHDVPSVADGKGEDEGYTSTYTDPETGDIDHHLKEGGLIYGGCYNSGVTVGNVIMNVASHMQCEHIVPEDEASFGDLTSLKYNIGRVYGGGFGRDTEVRGNTDVHLIMGFRGMNVFGGGLGGNVTGRSSVTYFGTEESYVYGAIYGGGMQGEVGTGYRVYETDADGNQVLDAEGHPILVACTDSATGQPAQATEVKLYSGNVSRVFGGSCLADVYGSTKVDIIERDVEHMEHIDLDHMSLTDDQMHTLIHSHLIAGDVYGGNDIAGHIYTFGDVPSTTVSVREVPKEHDLSGPGSAGAYCGFPLIGSLYAGSNGNYGKTADGMYTGDSEVSLYFGKDEGVFTDEDGHATLSLVGVKVPDVERASMSITGGTIVNVYGGGNRATVTESSDITVNFEDTDSRAGFDTSDDDIIIQYIWNLHGLKSKEQFSEVLADHTEEAFVYRYQIYHLYSGNNRADMAIQPQVNLTKGHIGSVYGGGNIGRMTYYRYDSEAPEGSRNKGISMSVTSPDIHIEEIFGGGRVGDIIALDAEGNMVEFGAGEYGATLNITAGLIEAVYGGNDVSGTVHNGTNVNIYGAISGDVYGAGNGNYLYRYDPDLELDSEEVIETYDDEEHGGRYFRVAPLTAFGGKSATAAQRIMAINYYRPNVDKAYLNIQGTETETEVEGTPQTVVNHVWVKGNVYCGGNSSTIHTETADERTTIRFNIGDHVTLNGVFLGSNGEHLVDLSDGGMIQRFEKLNDLDMSEPNDLTADQLPLSEVTATSHDHYPWLLSLYMRAVEVDGVPDEFRFDITKDDSYVGNLCLGGNHGSMMTDKTLAVTVPEALTVYGNIVGGCYNTAFTYRGRLHSGGMTRFLNLESSGGAGSGDVGTMDPTTDEYNKVWLTVKCKFAPLRIEYNDDDDISSSIRLVEDIVTGEDGRQYYGANRCNIYGGCFESGLSVGDIRIDLYSNMLANADTRLLVNGIDRQIRAFDVVGAGYGKMSMLIGDTKVRMLPGVNAADEVTHPGCAAIFGGSQTGQMIGNTYVSVRDGMVLSNLYGASESALLYGSTNVVIGYPQMYRCQQQGVYTLTRADSYSQTAEQALTNVDGTPIIKTEIWYNEGDIVPANVYEEISGRRDGGAGDKTGWFENVTIASPEFFGVKWDDIDIHIGMNNVYEDPESSDYDEHYYGHGNVYGGGFVTNQSDVTLAKKPTVLKFDEYACAVSHRPELLGYGGNAMILIGDNANNADITFNGAEGEALRDHISIGTARLIKVKLDVGANKIGKYYYDRDAEGHDRYVHQEAGIITEEDVAAGRNVFYEVEADGGIYGGGRKVYVEAFTACDLGCYGYADYTPQHPKLLNTIQRLDLMTMRDCCMQLIGAADYASSTLDATLYSMTRIGEFRMISSLPLDADLDPGVDPTAGMAESEINPLTDKPGYMLHRNPRTRNYMGFFNNVRYVGAMYSSTPFDGVYHDAQGNTATPSYHYRTYKEEMVRDRLEENVVTHPRRNVATSHNMIGINNGYTLKVQGQYTDQTSTGTIVDAHYYGPIIGVVEVKLLTLISDEGGGYIYALNMHDRSKLSRAVGDEEFTEMTGNFVFPGRAFTGDGEAHYILDDCYPYGYDVMEETSANGWEDEEIHYWYVSGNSYYFNATLTAYTYNKPTGTPKTFYLDNYDALIMLAGVEPDVSSLSIKSVVWGDHVSDTVTLSDGTEADYDCDLTNYGRTGSDAYQLYLSVDKNYDVDHAGSTSELLNSGAYVSQLPRTDYTISADPQTDTTADGVTPNAAGNGTYGDKSDGSYNTPLLGICLRDAVDNSDSDYYAQHLSQPDDVTIVVEATKPDENGLPITTTYTLNLTIVYLQGPQINGHIQIANCALPGEIVSANTGDMQVNLSEALSIENRQWILKPRDRGAEIDVTEYRTSDDYTRLELPVWYYQDGWDLCYRLTINDEPFDIETDPASEHPCITVHNYHRMKAMYGTHEIYQVLTPGSRIYIEDAADLERFFALADTLSMPTHVPGTLVGSAVKDRPSNCEGLRFFLESDLEVPAGHTVPAAFAGALYGMGHTLTAADSSPLMGNVLSGGEVRDLGYLAAGNAYMYNSVAGELVNCWYYNPAHKGGFVNAAAGLTNCYQNVSESGAGNYATDEDFMYGRVAYNLNEYYLQGRYATLTSTEPHVTFLDELYYNGDYRYAHWDQQWGVGAPDALRTAARPNYFNFDLSGKSNHSTLHPTSSPRYVPEVLDGDAAVIEPAHFVPLYPEDYLMFGQTLAFVNADTHPVKYATSNRVYRASGFYRSKQDRGLHFNAAAEIVVPSLTAADFTGYRDRGVSPACGLTVNALKDEFYAPMLDMPAEGLASWAVRYNDNIDATDAITRNLLVYTTDEMQPLFASMRYDRYGGQGSVTGHLVLPEGDGYTVNDGLLHLVDKQDFNAPITFTVGSRAWYDRAPAGYAAVADAWEGLCLPFGVNRVSAFYDDLDETDPSLKAPDVINHGEITHFFGDETPYETNIYTRLHEYWLRSMVSGATGDNLMFARPGMSARPYLDASGNPWSQLTAVYHYSNQWFPATYGIEYIDHHNQYTATGIDMVDYRFITAGLPYIVAFPGERYYEFDLSGEFYRAFMGESEKMPMSIRYEYLVDGERANITELENSDVSSYGKSLLRVGVSDDQGLCVSADGHYLNGTFLHRDVSGAGGAVIDTDGARFERATPGESVLPFRVYLTSSSPIGAPMRIIGADNDMVTDPGEDDAPGIANADIVFTLDDNVLVAESPRDATVPLCDMGGHVLRLLHVQAGRTEFRDILPGMYIAGTYKFRIY